MVVQEPGTSLGPRTRWLAGLVVAALPLLVIAVTYRWWRDRLPDPMPSHWNLHGQVDGTTSLSVLVTALGLVAAAGAVPALVAVLAGDRLRWRLRRALVCTGAAVAGFGAGLWLLTASLALDVADASRTPPPSWHMLGLIASLAIPPAVAFVALGPAPAAARATRRPASDLPRVRLAAGQRAAWSELLTPPRPIVLVPLLLLAVVAVVMVVSLDVWAATPVILTGVLAGMTLVVRLTVDAAGVHVGFGPWGWPRVTVPLAEIEYAETAEVRPSEWGGWGYRLVPGGRALVMRRGPGVRLALSEGRTFVTSTRDPETVAGLVNALVDRSVR